MKPLFSRRDRSAARSGRGYASKSDPVEGGAIGAGADRRSDLVMLTEGASEAAAAFRNIATGIVGQQLRNGRRGLAICAPNPMAGVSFVAANLAIVLAQMNISTLLIDGNLRAPAQHRLFGEGEEAEGLQQVIRSDRLAVQDVIRSNVVPGLSLLYAGGAADDADQLLGGARFSGHLQACLRDYDFTLIDTPPADRFSDALTIGAATGYGLIIARRNLSYVDDVTELARQLEESNVTIAGYLFNRL